MKKSLMLILIGVVLSGCAVDDGVTHSDKTNAVSINYKTVNHPGSVLSSVSFASGVRWNEEYLVGVKHLEEGVGLARCTSDELDLAFYKAPIKSGEKLPLWVNMKSGSTVQMEGFVENGKQLKTISGQVKPGIFTYAGQAKYKLASNLVSKGMSGGPVKDSNQKVVGLIVGYTAEPVRLVSDSQKGVKEGQYSVLIPYSTIVDGWEEVQTKLKQGKC